MIIYSLLLIVMMLLRPQGLLGGRELWPRRAARRRAASTDDRDDRRDRGRRPTMTAAERAAPSRRSSKSTTSRVQFGGLAAVSDFTLRARPRRARRPDRPQRRRQDDRVQPHHRRLPAHQRRRSASTAERIDGLPPVAINRAGIARTFQNIRLFAEPHGARQRPRRLQPLRRARPARHDPPHAQLRPRARRRRSRAAWSCSTRSASPTRPTSLAKNLPYGDQRRLEIARALATDPKILLLDEPAAGMNPQEKVELMELIRFIRDRFGVGILLIEHDMKLVMSDLRADHGARPRRDDRGRHAAGGAVRPEGDRGVSRGAGMRSATSRSTKILQFQLQLASA